MDGNAGVANVDPIGFAVSSLDEAIRFWTEALGFTLERQAQMGGDFLHQVTGVDDPSVRTAIVKAPDGFIVELLQYSKGRRNGQSPDSAGAIGAAHLALTVRDIHAAICRVEAAGWKAKGKPLPIPEVREQERSPPTCPVPTIFPSSSCSPLDRDRTGAPRLPAQSSGMTPNGRIPPR